jgi:hypothetical protein
MDKLTICEFVSPLTGVVHKCLYWGSLGDIDEVLLPDGSLVSLPYYQLRVFCFPNNSKWLERMQEYFHYEGGGPIA